ncbi:MAG: DNA-3-methyladenine glycosylase 2 family protein [Actinomycetota bacterium]|nr:DNA-3-methyladenine glycosylase 2 family protein [Actinomycetota bacterium]
MADGWPAVPEISTIWSPGRPVPLRSILGPTRRGTGDPTQTVRGRMLWRGQRTPHGPATIAVQVDPALGEVHARAWGPGADWALTWLPSSLGGLDDPSGFVPAHPDIAAACRLHTDWRVPRTGLVFEALVGAAVEQKVTAQEAFSGWRTLVHRYGEAAPGPAGAWGLMVLPAPSVVRQIASWQWLDMSIDGARAQVVVRAATRADALQRTLDLPADAADAALRSLPGVGVWTSAEVRQRAHGHADAVSFGDYHVASSVGLALTGEPVDDAAMAGLLAPYRPHRYRVQRMVELTRIRKERRGPRLAPRRHLPGSR